MRSPYTTLLRVWPAALVLGSVVPAAGSNYANAVKDLNPVCYWRLGEPAGAVAYDSSANNLDGTYVGGVTLGQPGALLGDSDTAAAFNGIDTCVEIPHEDSMRLDSGTVQLWFRLASTAADAGLFSKDSHGFDTGGHLTARIAGGRVVVRLQSTSSDHVVSSSDVSVNEWHQVAFTFGSAGMKLYLDDQLIDTDGYTGGTGTTSGGTGNYEPIVLAANSWASDDQLATPLVEYFSGRMDEVVIFDRALSAGEVQNLYEVATIPEPCAVALLAIGCVVVVRRKAKASG
jgi:hypothetical protein